MNSTEKMMWTVVPGGRSATTLRLSVVVTPKLEALGTTPPYPMLSDYPYICDWAKNVTDLPFVLEFKGSGAPQPIKTTFADSWINSIDPDLWYHVFPPDDTPVIPHYLDTFTDRRIHSYRIRGVIDEIQSTYTKTAIEFQENIPTLKGSDTNNHLRDFIDANHAANSRIREMYDGTMEDFHFINEKTKINNKFNDIALAYRFYNRGDFKDQYKKGNAIPKPRIEIVDFHKMVSSLGDHPYILRKLGLIIDLEIQIKKENKGAIETILNNDSLFVRLVPPRSAAMHGDATPWTAFTISTTTFSARSKSGVTPIPGRINLGDGSHDLIEVDPDGAALKIMHYSEALHRTFRRRQKYNGSHEESESAALPNLREGGIMVTQDTRAQTLWKKFVDLESKKTALTGSFAGTGQLDVFLEDLSRGYRVDVWQEEDKLWHPLCQRHVQYECKGLRENLETADEGYVKSASVSSQGREDLYLHEAMFRWTGWSLVVQKPGRTSVSKMAGNTIVETNETWPKYPVESIHEKGLKIHPLITLPQPSPLTESSGDLRLPSLRFGHRYRMRVRIADIAGNGEQFNPDWTSLDDQTASPEIQYYRFDPIPPPVVALRNPVSEGESLECMVIRSNRGVSTADYSDNLNDLLNSDVYHETSSRHFFPPKTSQMMVETQGLLDPYINEGKYDQAYSIASKENGSLFEPGSPTIPDPLQPVTLKTLGDRYLDTDDPIKVPYLPDPLSRGVALRKLPYADMGDAGFERIKLPKSHEFVIKVPFSSPDEKEPWPGGYIPFRLVLKEGSAPPTWKADVKKSPVLEVSLNKGEQVRIFYSSYPYSKDLHYFGITNWVNKAQTPTQEKDRMNRVAAAGAHWMISPYREIRLVHAVQQPLKDPKLHDLGLKKHSAETYVTFDNASENGSSASSAPIQCRAECDAKSTAKLDIMAEWDEWTQKGNDTPVQIHRKDFVCEIKVDDVTQDILPLAPTETKTEYRKYTHQIGDTRHRWIRYYLIGTTRFKEFLPEAIVKNVDQITCKGPKYQEVSVKSSARPLAPKILYVVPIFEWRDPDSILIKKGIFNKHKHGLKRERVGNALRVYLEGPWFSSGDEEELGVVLMRDPGGILDDSLKPYISQCGLDPIWAPQNPITRLTPEHFSLATHKDALNATLDELADSGGKHQPVSVAAHPVQYDPIRKLWFCDIKIDTGSSYFPFIRLALARYQPESVPNQYLSRVVLAEFAQTVPDRTASVVTSGDSEGKSFVVSVSGIYPGTGKIDDTYILIGEKAILVHARIEVADTGIPEEKRDPSLHWYPIEGTVVLNPLRDADVVTWTGTVTVPESPSTKQYRIVLEEFEIIPQDTLPGIEDIIIYPTAARLVYADRFEVKKI
jgi:hypothetical protein